MVLPPPDPFWDHVGETNGRKKCKFCQKEFAGDTSISRIKWHLSGVKGRGVATCKKVPDKVRQAAYDAANKRQKTMPSSSNMEGERNLPFAEDANQDHMEIMDTETLQIIPTSITPERVPVNEHEIRVPEQNNEDLGIQQEVRGEREFSGAEAGIQRENRTRETSQPIHRSITLERPPVDEPETRGATTQLLADEVGPVIAYDWGVINASTSTRNDTEQNNEVAELFDDLQPYFAKQRMEWQDTLLKINEILDDTEQKAQTGRFKIWRSKIRDLGYDVEDILDEFEAEDLESKLKSGESQGSTSAVQPGVATPNWSKLKDIDARWKDIMKERNDLGLDINVRGSSNKVDQRRLTTSLVKEPKVYGRENDKEDLVQLVMKEEPSNSRYSVIPIVGMGGIGKTTLAQYVYNDERLKFDYKAWVCVSTDFDILRLTKTILRHWESCKADDLNVLQGKLKEKLHGKKFFIVLDDVWQHNYEDWTTLCGPFAAAASGSKIIITTREKDVSLRMTSADPYNLKELPNDECLSLFSQHALEAENFEAHPDLEAVGQKIVQRCKGLPLAAKTLGGLLRHKQDLEDWEEILNSDIWDLSEGESVILSALRLSYLHLPSHLKRCFRYCAIFPKDYLFDENELVFHWMAGGFIQKTKQKKDLGHKYFKDLLSRSLFQQCSDNKSLYVMHDLISDLAQSVSGEICIHLHDDMKSSDAKVRHLSFTSHEYDTLQRFKAVYQMESLRTFIAIPNSSIWCDYSLSISTDVLDDLVPKLKCLRTLSLASYDTLKELPESIGALKLLRYLNLSNTAIVRLPVSLGNLLNLQTLILRGCNHLVELPASIGDLFNLQHLDIEGTLSLKKMPPEISKLKNLNFLSKFVVGEGNGLGIGELMRLNGLGIGELMRLPHLQGKLCITGLQNVTNIQDAKLANLKERKGLRELVLEWSDKFLDVRDESHEKQVFNSLQPHQSLEKLSIISFGGTEFPSWVGGPSFSKMVDLQLSNCPKITSLPSLGELAALKHLSIKRMHKLEVMTVADFPSLETLYIEGMPKWEQWNWSNGLNEEPGGKFPKLVEFTLKECPKLIGKLPRCLPSLKKLHISGCGELTNLPEMLPSLCELKVEGCHEVIFQMVPDFTSLKRFEIRRISGLVSLPDTLVKALVALEDLVIGNCVELNYLWRLDGVDVDKLANLKQLQISCCMKLQSLVVGEDELLPPSLQVLSLRSCDNLEKLPNGLYCLTSLRELRIWNFSNQSRQCLVEELVIDNCPSLQSFPKGKLPTTLKELRIEGVAKVLESEYWFLEEIMHCDAHLEDLAIERFSITSFPAGQFPSSLKTLTFCNCRKLESLPSLLHLSHLNELRISWCDQLVSLTDEELPNLISLKIHSCDKLRSLPNHMDSLQQLNISLCSGLVSFPETGFPNLISLYILRCDKLTSLPNHMDSLQQLEISYCSGLVSFPETGFPPKLTSLAVTECKNLRQPITEWRLHTLISLKHLGIDFKSPYATDVDYFPDEDGLLLPTSLTSLVIFCHENLKSISRGIQHLTFLERLQIQHCPKLHVLPKEGFPETLGYLCIYKCPLLKVEDHRRIISHIPRVYIYSDVLSFRRL